MDGLWSHSEGVPCVHWVTNTQSGGKVGKRTAATACCVQKRMEADDGRQGWYSVPDSWRDTTAFLWSGFASRPSFSSRCCRCVCFERITTRFIHTAEAEQMGVVLEFRSEQPSRVNRMAPVGRYHEMSLGNTISAA